MEDGSLSLTVSRATANEEGTDAVAGLRGSRGALFWIPRARVAILRRDEEEESGPKDIEWKDSGVLRAKSVTTFALEVNDAPKPHCGATKVLSGTVGYCAFAIRQENHDWCSKLQKRQTKELKAT
jgi:hypothetical protein